jgi:hypothetical protein
MMEMPYYFLYHAERMKCQSILWDKKNRSKIGRGEFFGQEIVHKDRLFCCYLDATLKIESNSSREVKTWLQQ